jgi:hypothetical protein
MTGYAVRSAERLVDQDRTACSGGTRVPSFCWGWPVEWVVKLRYKLRGLNSNKPLLVK